MHRNSKGFFQIRCRLQSKGKQLNLKSRYQIMTDFQNSFTITNYTLEKIRNKTIKKYSTVLVTYLSKL